MLAQSTDSGQLIAAGVIKLFHAMKLQVEDLRGVGIQVQLLEGHTWQDSAGPRTRSIKDMLLERRSSGKASSRGQWEDSLLLCFNPTVSLVSIMSVAVPLYHRCC